jgi:hypothetical protein
MSVYIDYQSNARLVLEDEPRIRPMTGTYLEDFLQEESTKDQALLQYGSDNESNDDGDVLQTMEHLTAYWKPKCGDINILPPMYAKEITQLTGSSLFAEVAEKRYRIIQGDFRRALTKLQRLETLLVGLFAFRGICQ